jgi:hypothetical protein
MRLTRPLYNAPQIAKPFFDAEVREQTPTGQSMKQSPYSLGGAAVAHPLLYLESDSAKSPGADRKID